MAKIALVNPPFLFWDDGFENLKSDHSPALGLYILAAEAKRAGHEVRMVDLAIQPRPYAQALAEILEFSPDLVGLAAVTVNVHHAARFAADLKKQRPEILAVLGGPHGTALPDETLKRYPVFDAVVLGEGERTLLELLENPRGNGAWEEVAGLALPRDGTCIHTAPRERIHDLDRIAFPAWEYIPDYPEGYTAPLFNFKRLPAATLITSRGCPLHCKFCSRAVFGNRIRFHSAAYVLEMVDLLHRQYGVRHLIFYDDMFVANRKRLIEICEGLLAYKGRISFSCNGRIGYMSRETLGLLKKAGCWQIAYGIESGTQKILDILDKRQTLDQIENEVRMTREAGIRVKGLFMMGLPGESAQSVWATVRFAARLRLDLFQITKFTPLPGSPLYREAERWGTFENDWTRMNMLNILFVPFGLTRRDLEALFWRINQYYYSRAEMAFKFAKFFLAHPHQLGVGMRIGLEFFG
ncbi:MAG: B12-binding domain-containing radical SAM protein, partial [Planctomycetota bacterium]